MSMLMTHSIGHSRVVGLAVDGEYLDNSLVRPARGVVRKGCCLNPALHSVLHCSFSLALPSTTSGDLWRWAKAAGFHGEVAMLLLVKHVAGEASRC